jgi:fructokinase
VDAPASADFEAPARVVLGIGELLWDLLPAGPRLGGAPFNAIAHLARLGYAVTYVTSVGPDDLGRATLAAARRLGVEQRYIRTVDLPTGTARVELDADGSPHFEIARPAAYEDIDLTAAEVEEIVGLHPRAVVFGTLAQRSPAVRAVTDRLIEALPTALRVYDVNLRKDCWSPPLVDDLMRRATVVKLNADEMASLATHFEAPAEPPVAFCASVAERFSLLGVCVTRGPLGAGLWLEGGYFEEPGVPVRVVDTVGAGDAFTAALIDGLIRRDEPRHILRSANALGAFVASRPGVVPEPDG